MRHRSLFLKPAVWLGLVVGLLGGTVVSLPAAVGDRVVLLLTNGDRVSGVLVEEAGSRLVLSNAWNPALQLELSAVVERLEGGTSTAASNAVAAATGEGAGGGLVSAPAKKASRWKGEWEVGADLRRGERNTALYHSRLKVGYVHGRFRNLADLNYTYGKTDGTLSANRVDGSLKTDFDLNRRVFVYNYFDAVFDEVRKIDLRYQVGPGVGYHLIMASNLVVDVEAGASYEDERRSDGTRRDNVSVRLAQSLQWRVSDRLRVEESFDIYPRFTGVTDFRLRLEVGLKYLLYKRVSLNLSVLDLYDRTPAAGVSRNDLQLRSALGVTF